jgi:hypothetical protein
VLESPPISGKFFYNPEAHRVTSGQCDAGDWFPDLRTREVIFGVLIKF